jgi:hypothetical protein
MALQLFHRYVLLANCGENAELSNAAKHVDSYIRAARGVTHVFSQFFLTAVETEYACFNSYSRHRYSYSSGTYFNVGESCGATKRQRVDLKRP